MKSRVILVSAVSLVSFAFPLMLADAGDGVQPFMPDPAVTGTASSPVQIEPLGAAALQPVMPVQLQPSPQIILAATAASSNPFAVPTQVAAPSGPAIVAANPFALPASRVPVGKDAAPFSLGGMPVDGIDPMTTASLGEAVDVTALRYYASQRDLARVGAETRRLKSLYPSWEPPTDLFVEPSSIDEQPLWDLFAQGNYAEQRLRIEELKAANPGWLPSTDLMTKLEDAEARLSMRAAYSVGNWDQVIGVAQSRDTILVCSQIEALWQLGEALARKGDYATAFDTYKYVLGNCSDAKDRLSTVQKASLVLPPVGMEALVLLGKQQPDGTSEFSSIAFDELRRRIASNVNDRFEADAVMPDELERFVNFVQVNRSPEDIGLVAWYYYSQKEWDAARAWFSLGNKVKRDPKFLEGQILAMRASGATGEALEMAIEFRERSPELTQQYIELVAEILSDPTTTLDFPKRDLKIFEEIVLAEESALGAQAIGWRYIEDDSLNRAGDWFERSMEWEITEGGVIGQAVVASRLKHYKTLKSLKATYGDEYAELDDFTVYTPKVKKARSVAVRSYKPTEASCRKSSSEFGLLALFACRRS